MVLVAGQLFGMAHEASTRHVRCAQHGETLEAASLTETFHESDDTRLVGVSGDTGAEHADCEIARALHASSASVTPFVAPAVVARLIVADDPLVATSPLVRSLYRIAPKTSPPA